MTLEDGTRLEDAVGVVQVKGEPVVMELLMETSTATTAADVATGSQNAT